MSSADEFILQGESLQVCNLFSDRFTGYGSYLIYLDYRREVSTNGIIAHLLGLGRKVYVPVVVGDTMGYAPYAGEGSQGMHRNRFGILEPVAVGNVSTNFTDIDVIVTPCVACDIYGNRLGRGKGYYDKVLQKFNGVSICLGYSFQLYSDDSLAAVTEAHDVAVTYVLTNEKIYGGLEPT